MILCPKGGLDESGEYFVLRGTRRGWWILCPKGYQAKPGGFLRTASEFFRPPQAPQPGIPQPVGIPHQPLIMAPNQVQRFQKLLPSPATTSLRRDSQVLRLRPPDDSSNLLTCPRKDQDLRRRPTNPPPPPPMPLAVPQVPHPSLLRPHNPITKKGFTHESICTKRTGSGRVA